MFSQVESLKLLAGPIYDIGEAKYNFNEIEKHAESIKDLNFPVLITADSQHSFNEVKRAHREKYFQIFSNIFSRLPSTQRR